MQTTVQSALAFATGEAVTAAPAVALAERVLHRMLLTKLKIGAVLLLVLTTAATGVGVLAFGGRDENRPEVPTPPTPRAKEPDKPALPKEWAGRWVVDPFAGAESIEVRHAAEPGKGGAAGGGATYVIKDLRALAEVLKAVKVAAVQNTTDQEAVYGHVVVLKAAKGRPVPNEIVGLVPAADLTVRKKDGSTFRAGIQCDGLLACDGGIVHLDEQFFAALNRRLSEQEKKKVNVLEYLPAPPASPAPPVQEVPPSLRSLTTGFTTLEVQYSVGKHLHRARLTDEKTLDTLHKALTVIKQEEAPKGTAAGLGLVIRSKDRSSFNGRILSETEFYDARAGKFTVTPEFFQALGKEVGRLEGRDIDVVKENAFTEQQVKRKKEFRKLLEDVVSLSYATERRGKKETIVVDQPDAVTKLVKDAAWVDVPLRETKLDKGAPLELTTKDGKKIAVTLLKTGPDNERVDCAPLLGDLVEVEGFGQLWLANQWKYRLQQHAIQAELAAKERQSQETAALVCRDFPLFLKQVLNVVAGFREEGIQVRGCVDGDGSRAVLEALAAAKLEGLDWTRERWEKELRDLRQRGAGALDLTPGLGFKLTLVVSSDKEMLVPTVGKLTFAKSPLAALQKAIDADKANEVELLPRAK
jgi:hypothetical protein